MRALGLSIALMFPHAAMAQDNKCVEYAGQQICDCSNLAPDVRICGGWDKAWLNGIVEPPYLAILSNADGGLATITGTTEPMPSSDILKATFLSDAPAFEYVRDVSTPTVPRFEVESFTGIGTRNDIHRSPHIISILAGPQGTFFVESIYFNAFAQPDAEELSPDMQAQHDALLALIEVETP